MKFILISTDNGIYGDEEGRKLTLEFEADSVDDVLVEITSFLKGCGFNNGNIVEEVIEDDLNDEWVWNAGDDDEEYTTQPSFEVSFSDNILGSALQEVSLNIGSSDVVIEDETTDEILHVRV